MYICALRAQGYYSPVTEAAGISPPRIIRAPVSRDQVRRNMRYTSPYTEKTGISSNMGEGRGSRLTGKLYRCRETDTSTGIKHASSAPPTDRNKNKKSHGGIRCLAPSFHLPHSSHSNVCHSFQLFLHAHVTRSFSHSLIHTLSFAFIRRLFRATCCTHVCTSVYSFTHTCLPSFRSRRSRYAVRAGSSDAVPGSVVTRCSYHQEHSTYIHPTRMRVQVSIISKNIT